MQRRASNIQRRFNSCGQYYRRYVCYVRVGRIGQLTHVTILLKHVTAHIHLTRNIFRTRCYPDPPRTHIHICIAKSAVRFARHVCNPPARLTLMLIRNCCVIKHHAPIIFFNLIPHPHFSHYHENVIIARARSYYNSNITSIYISDFVIVIVILPMLLLML